MGFQKVFDFLREIFPEVDCRILRAVALENPQDVNEAVTDVLTDVIPRFYEETNYPSKDASLVVASNIEVEDKKKTDSLRADISEVGLDHVAPGKSSDLVHEDHDHKQIHPLASHLKSVNEDFKGDKKLFDGADGSFNDFHSHVIRDQVIRDVNTMFSQELFSVKSRYDCSIPVVEELDSQIGNPSFENHSPVQPETQLHSEPDYQKSGTSNPSPPKQDCSTGEMSENEDRLNNSVITQSGEPCRLELLDEIIEDAKSNKIFLFAAMESVIDKMRELERKGKEVEKAREEAANGGSEITVKLEKLKQTVAHTIEENDMLAGEVYGEKAILATETRELQSRLRSLSDERDNSLSILDEMQATIEARIAALDDMLEAAHKAKLAKEEEARNALAEQDAFMQKLLVQAVILRREEEENSKLRDFLMSRGHIVDMLQGEISVICQDVRHLKEKFDEKVPLSQSLSSSQTSCILASSGSSLKSTAFNSALFCLPVNDVPSDFAYEKGASPNTSKKGSRASSISSSSSKSLEEKEEEMEKTDSKALSDDGWDVFDKEAEFAEAPYLVYAKE